MLCFTKLAPAYDKSKVGICVVQHHHIVHTASQVIYYNTLTNKSSVATDALLVIAKLKVLSNSTTIVPSAKANRQYP